MHHQQTACCRPPAPCCTARLSLPVGSPRAHTPLHRLVEDFVTQGSTVLLRPSAPVYCCDLDPAALGGVSSSAATTAGQPAAGLPEAPQSSGPEVALGASGGVAGIGSRCGYRAFGFGPPQQTRPSSSSGGGPSSSSQAAQPAQAGPTAVQASASTAPVLCLPAPLAPGKVHTAQHSLKLQLQEACTALCC
jgi:hypothetical protein